ncbi:hypothetical protein PF008_g26003 [Phytophthora fragariae]|uniref:Uncharacterized protein n=1 Tax=Phytophthora fragariae TaxID=53985 RepID=A0A6G0QIG0_9STRA|nr:hypothetical protein PF008_g26003 [Phytophthora fragariae]
MADAFVIGGDGVSLFASVGIMMPLASRQEDVSDPLKESDLRDRLMQDLGLSDTADSDEEEWAPDPTIALKLDGFREPLKDSELQDRLMKDLGLSDSDEESGSQRPNSQHWRVRRKNGTSSHNLIPRTATKKSGFRARRVKRRKNGAQSREWITRRVMKKNGSLVLQVIPARVTRKNGLLNRKLIPSLESH